MTLYFFDRAFGIYVVFDPLQPKLESAQDVVPARVGPLNNTRNLGFQSAWACSLGVFFAPREWQVGNSVSSKNRSEAELPPITASNNCT